MQAEDKGKEVKAILADRKAQSKTGLGKAPKGRDFQIQWMDDSQDWLHESEVPTEKMEAYLDEKKEDAEDEAYESEE